MIFKIYCQVKKLFDIIMIMKTGCVGRLAFDIIISLMMMIMIIVVITTWQSSDVNIDLILWNSEIPSYQPAS